MTLPRALVVCAMLSLMTSTSAAGPPKVAVLEFSAKAGASKGLSELLADLVANAIRDLGNYEVIGKSDITSLIGFEQIKDKLGCDDTSCLAEIGGALGVDLLVTGNFGRVGNIYLVNLKLIDPGEARVISGISRNIKGQEEALVENIPGIIADLFSKERPAAPAAPTTEHPQATRSDEEGEPRGRYDSLLKDARDKKKVEEDKQTDFEKSWKQISEIVNTETLDRDKRLAALSAFMKDFPGEHEHSETARYWHKLLSGGNEPSGAIDQSVFQVEWVGLRFSGGNYGGGGGFSAFTLRWQYFYWELMRIYANGGGKGAEFTSDPAFAFAGGMAFGFPWALTTNGRHELRFGTGLFGGAFYQGRNVTSNSDQDHVSYGPIILLESYYLWHYHQYFSLQVGVELFIPTYNPGEPTGCESRDCSYEVPHPAFSASIGFRI